MQALHKIKRSLFSSLMESHFSLMRMLVLQEMNKKFPAELTSQEQNATTMVVVNKMLGLYLQEIIILSLL